MSVRIVRSFHGRPHLIDSEDAGSILRLDLPVPGPIPWWGARTLLALLRSRFGSRIVEQALAPHRALLRLVLRGLEPELTPEGRERAAFVSANFRGSLPNPQLRPEAIGEAWAGAIDSILTGVEAAKGNVAEAESLFRRCLAMKEELLGPLHPDAAITANNLAMLLANEGRFDEAAPLLGRAIDILEQSVESDHPMLAMCRENCKVVEQRR